jgi:16S rRNA (cytidine1402-2'-O)-methyltransferase
MTNDPDLPSASFSPRAIPPGLHLVATPIGAARDITLHALDVLRGADHLAAEDTRTLRKLMEIHGIPLAGRPLTPYHDHNGPQARPRLLQALEQGQSVAYASEAGTPLVADPGFQLARQVIAAGFPVHSAPGASAVLAALSVSGLPSDRFCFVGFAPATRAARRKFLQEVCAIPATLIFYESPRRIRDLLADLSECGAGGRSAALCRELTKKHEEVLRMNVVELTHAIAERDLRGEIVLVLDRGATVEASAEMLDDALRAALDGASLRDAVAQVAQALNLPRKQVYDRALHLSQSAGEQDDG